MKLSKKMYAALNEQIKWEFESAYMYLGMAAYLNDVALPGFAHWMREQAKEEIEHGMRIYNYLEDRGNRAELLPIAAPAKTYKSVQEVMEKSLEHEQFVTALINKLVDLAAAEKDHATSIFLQWFVSEQVEEEDLFNNVLDKLSMVKGTCSALLFLDKQMGKREGDD